MNVDCKSSPLIQSYGRKCDCPTSLVRAGSCPLFETADRYFRSGSSLSVCDALINK